jgi:cytochrome bd-type quinol oxidase subunit 2
VTVILIFDAQVILCPVILPDHQIFITFSLKSTSNILILVNCQSMFLCLPYSVLLYSLFVSLEKVHLNFKNILLFE